MVLNRVPVNISQGTLIGIESTLPNGQPYYSFKGIPYAKPPVGDLRFELPVPLEKFPKNPLTCFEERNMCLQNNPFKGGIIDGSEDCLYLNIYSPSLKPDKSMPVMIWIHGGGFVYGNGNSDYYLPLYLMQEGVVVVTFTFRLGIFGYLCLPGGGIRGNMGLHDQLAAFKWIKGNISEFGGDPENATLFGVSSGAATTHLHVLSHESQKYIHKAIMQGGNALTDWCLQNNPLRKPRRLAELMGCRAKSDKEIGKFLKQEKDPVKLHKHVFNLLTPKELRLEHKWCLRPVVERNVPNAIITRPPLELAVKPNTIHIPLMMGYNNKEGICILKEYEDIIEELDKDLARLIPHHLNLPEDDPKCFKVVDEIRQFYFKGEKLTEELREGLIDLLSDNYFIIAKYFAAEMHSRYQHGSPFYMYRFSFEGKLNFFKKDYPMIKGACHADERFYIFQKSVDDGLLQPGTREELTVKRMCRMWANFAKYGNPTPFIDDIIKWKWNPVRKICDQNEFTLDYLEIDDVVRMDKNPDKERIDFWRHISKKY